MNEEALNDAWALAKAEGFKGGQEDFKNLVQTNPDFFNMSYGTFKEKGFKGDESSFSQLLGIEPPKAKQEEQPQEVVQEQAMEPVDGEVPFVNNTNQTPEYLKAPETVNIEKEAKLSKSPLGVTESGGKFSVHPVAESTDGSIDLGALDKAKESNQVIEFDTREEADQFIKNSKQGTEEKPKVLKEDTTPFYLQAEDPYNKEKQLLVSDSQIKLQEEYDSQVIPVYQERFDEAIKAYIPLIEQKRAQIQSRLDSKEITEEEANTELTGYIQRAESASKSRAIKSKEVNAAFEKIIKPAGEELQKKITDVSRAQKVAAESRVEQYLKGVEESSKIERDELGYWESLGNTLYNEVAVNTLAAVPKMFQMAEQVVYNFTPYELEDVAMPSYNFEKGEIEYLTSPQVQARLIEDVDKLESKTKITKSSIEEFENGNYGGGLLIGAVGGATNLLGSMVRSYLTRGGSMFAETSEPIWRASVKQTAERTGKTVEEVLAENLEDEFTAVTVGVISGTLEKYGLDKVTKLLPKKGIISDIIKKEFKPSIPKLSKVIGTSLTETGTEYFQSGLETAATNMVEGGKSLTSAEGIKMFKDELLKYSTSKEAAEVVVSTALGTLLFGAGSAGINSVLNRTFNDAKVPKDLTGKEIESLISEGLNVKRDLLKAKTAGLISEEVFNKATYTLNEVNRVDNSLLADTKNRTEVVALAIKRDALKRVSETVDEGQKVFINDQIKELNTQIAELSVKEEPVKETVVEEQAPAETKVTAQEGQEKLTEAEKNKIAEKIGKVGKVTPKNIKGLLDVMGGIFGLNKKQAESAAVVGDVIIGNAAKRAGISKDEMYQKIAYQKAQMKDLPKGIKFQVDAWHGSPHTFDKFTTKKIGTGEGFQAFGWGLYFTDLEGIARSYAKTTPHNINSITRFEVDDILYEAIWNENGVYTLTKDEDSISEEDYTKAYNNYLKKLNISKNLYKVSLHKGKTPEQYTWLEWDKPMSDKALELFQKFNKEQGVKLSEPTEPTPKEDRMTAGQMYKWISDKIGQKDASLFLLENGIDGVKYPAESISRGATSDTARGFNYVVFDENAVSIEEAVKFQKDAMKARGAMMMAMDNQAIIYALTDPNVSTPLHELAHVYEHYLTDTERKAIESWSGHKAGTVEFSEAFARGFEKFLAEGKISNPKLQKIFENFKEWLTEIYNGIIGSDIDIELNDTMKGIYNNMLAEDVNTEGQEKVESADSVQQAKDNLSAAWKTWKEQQKNLGIAFNPQSKNKQDMALIRALLDYLKAVGARTVKDVIDSANQFTNSQINLDNKGAEYLLRASRNEFIRDRIEKGIKDGDSFTTIKNELESKGYEADEITKRYNAGLKESVPVTSQSLQESLDNFRDARNETGKNKQSLKDKIVSSAYKFIERTLDPRIDAKRILKSLGMQNALDKMQLLYGNSGAVKFRFTEAYDKIYKGLSSEDTLTLDYIIQYMRFISIDENRINLIDPPKIDHPDYVTGEQAKKLLDALNQKIGDTKYFALKDKADMYFEEFRKNLDMMENSGLITKELRDSLYEINYQPRKFLEYLMNDGKSNAQQQSNTGQNKDLIGKLGLGDDGKLFSDSQWLLSTAMMQVENAVKLNNFKAKIAESLTQAKDKYKQLVAKANKTKADKRFIADYKNSEDYFSQTDKKGFTALEYKEDGKTKKIFVREDIYKQLLNINDGPLGGNRLATVLDIIATLTGVKLLKLLATGINAGFVIGNFPNDFGFAITFEPAYSRFLPKAIIQLSSDVKRAVGSVLRKDQTFRDFVENGGMMDFMHQMGALEEKGALSNVINKGIDFLWDSKLFKERQKKITDGVTKLNMLSELGIRVAVYSRVLKGEMDKIEKQTFSTQADKQKAIQEAKEHAAARARKLIDFSQGGDIIKTADKVVPYLNAASQGGYAAAQGFLNNPGRTMGIMLQSMVILGGTAVGAGLGMIAMFGGDDEDEEKTVGEIFIETIDGISDYNKRKYICIPTGQKDDKGNYTYIKIKKTQNLTPLFLISEYHTNNLIRYMIGQELEPPSVLKTQLYDAVGDDIDPTGFMNPNQYKDGAFQGIANVVGNKSPLAAAAIVMGTGYDPYRKQSVDPPKGSFGDPNVEEFYKSLAEITGDKPERLQAATEKFITNPRTNPFIGPVYAFANIAVGDKDLKDLVVDPLNGFADGFKGRVLGSASEYPKIQRIEEKAKVLKEEIDKVDEKIHIKTSEAVNNFMNGDITKTELQNEASKIIKEYEIKDVKSYLEKINDRANNKKLPQIYFNIKYSDTSKNTPEVQALKIVEYFGSDILQDQEKFIEVYDNLKKVGLNMKGDIYDEVLKLTNPEDYKKYIEDKNKPLKKSTTLTYGLNSKPLG